MKYTNYALGLSCFFYDGSGYKNIMVIIWIENRPSQASKVWKWVA